jgi:hypothetical protein
MVTVITKRAGNKFLISGRWTPSGAKKFVRETKRGGLYARVLNKAQTTKIKRISNRRKITVKDIRGL